MSDSYQAIYDAVRSRISGSNVGEALESTLRDAFGDTRHIIQQSVWNVENEAVDAVRSTIRPSVLYRPTIGLDGNKWCALYGANLMEGVCGFGDSPAEAMADFDAEWTKKYQDRKAPTPKDQVADKGVA